MWNPLAVLLKDFYKVGHPFQYPKGTSLVYSNLTPRGTRRDPAPPGVVNFGPQAFVQRYLVEYFNEYFFDLPRYEVLKGYKRRVDNALGPGTSVDHITNLHDLGYLPVEVKSLPEGTISPYRVPTLTIRNTKPEFYWVTNMLETLISDTLFLAYTSATTAFEYRKVFEKYAKSTAAAKAFVPWQGHDFSMRGMEGYEAAMWSGAAHLLSFTGTDTIPAIDFLEQYYGADSDKELIGGSVPATEHSVMCMGSKEHELDTIRRLITETYPTGVVSIVSDTWDFWEVLSGFLPRLKTTITNRDGKLVIRPDSGDPVKIICGDPQAEDGRAKMGAIRLLWCVFGGTVNAGGFRELDPHIGLIYGDSITLERQEAILGNLAKMGFASSNVVLGIGSYTYQYVTRDTDGWAIKATYGETRKELGLDMPAAWEIARHNIYKDPKTDSGLKKSAKGLLRVEYVDNVLTLKEECSWEQERGGMLNTIFKDGKVFNVCTLTDIRRRLETYLPK